MQRKMMKKPAVALFGALVLYVSTVFSQPLAAYRIFDSTGKEVQFTQMAAALVEKDVVLFGETHNNPIDHWLQLELTKAIGAQKNVVLGAEMLEADDQVVLDEYLSGKIKLDHFKKEAKLWPNHATDYAPLVEYAKEKSAPFIATNVPRRYASLVSREGIAGLESLGKEAKAFMPNLPFEVTAGDKGYESMRAMMGSPGHNVDADKLVAAQALKDYTMAHNIAKNLRKGAVFIHFNGTFHSNHRSGICNYLLAENKKLAIGNIASVEAATTDWNSEWEGLGDFIIVKPEGMTKTH